MADSEQDNTQKSEADGLVRELYQALEEEESCQWHREHDKRNDLYLRTKRYLGLD